MYPTTIWIYTFPSPTTSESESSNPTPRLHTVLTFLSPIKTLQWSSIPTLIEEGVSAEVDCHFKDLLLIASGNQSFGIWTEVTAEKKKKESPAEGVAITIPSSNFYFLSHWN